MTWHKPLRPPVIMLFDVFEAVVKAVKPNAYIAADTAATKNDNKYVATKAWLGWS